MKKSKIFLFFWLFFNFVFIRGVFFNKKNIKMSSEYENYITKKYYKEVGYKCLNDATFFRNNMLNSWQSVKYLNEYFDSYMLASPVYYQWPDDIKDNILLHSINIFNNSNIRIKNILTEGFNSDYIRSYDNVVCSLNDPLKEFKKISDFKKNSLLQIISRKLALLTKNNRYQYLSGDCWINDVKTIKKRIKVNSLFDDYVERNFITLYYSKGRFLHQSMLTLMLNKDKLQEYSYSDNFEFADPGEVRIHKCNIKNKELTHIPLRDVIIGFVLNAVDFEIKELAEIYNIIIDIPHYKEKIEKGEIKFYSIYGKELDEKVLDEIKKSAKITHRKNEETKNIDDGMLVLPS